MKNNKEKLKTDLKKITYQMIFYFLVVDFTFST